MLFLQIVALLAASASAAVYSDDASFQKYQWEAFKLEYKKSYETMDIETRRFAIFLENLKVADLRNAAGNNYFLPKIYFYLININMTLLQIIN